MKFFSGFVATSVAGFILSSGSASASAVIKVALPAVDTGWYDSTGFHDSTNENYIAGNLPPELRDFFVFDLSGVTGPVTQAKLRLYNPGGLSDGYFSADATETFELYDVTTGISDLVSGGAGLVSIFNDLGTGAFYGSRVVSAADNHSLVDILLNANALVAINSALGSQFALGGTLGTFSGGTEFMFGYTDGTVTRQLILEVPHVPDAGANISFLGAACLGLSVFRRRHIA